MTDNSRPPDYIKALNERKARDAHGAIADAERRWKKHDFSSDLFSWLCAAYAEHKEYDKVDALCREAIGVLPEEHLGLVYSQQAYNVIEQGRGDAAALPLLELAVTHGGDSNAHERLMGCLKRLGKKEEYIAAARNAAAHFPDHPHFSGIVQKIDDGRGWVNNERGERQRTLEDLITAGQNGIEAGDNAKVRRSFERLMRFPFSTLRMSTLRSYAQFGVGVEEYNKEVGTQINAGKIQEKDRSFWTVAEQPDFPEYRQGLGPGEGGPNGPRTTRIYENIGTRQSVNRDTQRLTGIEKRVRRNSHEKPAAWKPEGWGKDWDSNRGGR